MIRLCKICGNRFEGSRNEKKCPTCRFNEMFDRMKEVPKEQVNQAILKEYGEK